jgi:hypothetical protein
MPRNRKAQKKHLFPIYSGTIRARELRFCREVGVIMTYNPSKFGPIQIIIDKVHYEGYGSPLTTALGSWQ